MKIITYRDIPADGYKDDLRLGDADDDNFIIKPLILPGLYGSPDLHVRRVIFPWGLLITYTYAEITIKKIAELIARSQKAGWIDIWEGSEVNLTDSIMGSDGSDWGNKKDHLESKKA